mmetsp:Transcript_135092/g.431671  ORF Transcript_135092/g.431671 Transcript_135092/m.431671 type:complete len:447 (+) Transcript_135092:300-1640(+)
MRADGLEGVASASRRPSPLRAQHCRGAGADRLRNGDRLGRGRAHEQRGRRFVRPGGAQLQGRHDLVAEAQPLQELVGLAAASPGQLHEVVPLREGWRQQRGPPEDDDVPHIEGLGPGPSRRLRRRPETEGRGAEAHLSEEEAALRELVEANHDVLLAVLPRKGRQPERAPMHVAPGQRFPRLPVRRAAKSELPSFVRRVQPEFQHEWLLAPARRPPLQPRPGLAGRARDERHREVASFGVFDAPHGDTPGISALSALCILELLLLIWLEAPCAGKFPTSGQLRPRLPVWAPVDVGIDGVLGIILLKLELQDVILQCRRSRGGILSASGLKSSALHDLAAGGAGGAGLPPLSDPIVVAGLVAPTLHAPPSACRRFPGEVRLLRGARQLLLGRGLAKLGGLSLHRRRNGRPPRLRRPGPLAEAAPHAPDVAAREKVRALHGGQRCSGR